MPKKITALIAAALCCFPSTVFADAVRGKIVQVQANQTASCRLVALKRDDTGAIMYFRIAQNTQDGILSTVLTALSTGLGVQITYATGQTTGCGSEPAIAWLDIYAPGY